MTRILNTSGVNWPASGFLREHDEIGSPPGKRKNNLTTDSRSILECADSVQLPVTVLDCK
jgi:hypothetical protein